MSARSYFWIRVNGALKFLSLVSVRLLLRGDKSLSCPDHPRYMGVVRPTVTNCACRFVYAKRNR